jgi:hypothetical protein
MRERSARRAGAEIDRTDLKTMTDYTKFSTWKKFLSGSEFQTESPFDRRPLGKEPVFLYSEITAPLPCASMSGSWTGYADVRQLAAHLRFGLLPGDFSIWLCRNEWDSADGEPKAAEAIFDGAKAADNRYIEDIPRMKKIIAELDAAIHAGSNADAWRHVDKACRLFNSRWKSTPTWNFFHKPLRDVKGLARDVARHGSVDEELKEGIKAIANGILSSAKVQRELRSLLKEVAVY